jgi:hypothetical protein
VFGSVDPVLEASTPPFWHAATKAVMPSTINPVANRDSFRTRTIRAPIGHVNRDFGSYQRRGASSGSVDRNRGPAGGLGWTEWTDHGHFQPEKQPDATKLTAQDITNFLGLRRYQTSSRPAWGAGFSIFTVIFTKVW